MLCLLVNAEEALVSTVLRRASAEVNFELPEMESELESLAMAAIR